MTACCIKKDYYAYDNTHIVYFISEITTAISNILITATDASSEAEARVLTKYQTSEIIQAANDNPKSVISPKQMGKILEEEKIVNLANRKLEWEQVTLHRRYYPVFSVLALVFR